jgi:hypothetical protein
MVYAGFGSIRRVFVYRVRRTTPGFRKNFRLLPAVEDLLKRVLKGVLLTPYQAAETDEIILECCLVFSLEIPAIERRVVRAEAEVDPSLVQPPRHLTHWGEVCKGASLQVGARTEFETDASLAHLWQQVRQMERDLHAVPDTAEIRKQRRMHVLGSRLAEMSCGREIVLGSLSE